MTNKIVLLLAFLLSLNAFASNIIEASLEQARLGNFKQAQAIILDAANGGDAEAQYVLSQYYRDPNGFNQPEVGEEWLHKAAKNGNPSAQYDYAWLLSSGWYDASSERLSEIAYWFEKAGAGGVTEAYSNLGVFYDNTKRNVVQEIEELANKGDAMAQYNLGWIKGRGLLTEDGLERNLDQAKEWITKSAEQGFEDAIEFLKNQ